MPCHLQSFATHNFHDFYRKTYLRKNTYENYVSLLTYLLAISLPALCY